jgi:hypothetical protein
VLARREREMQILLAQEIIDVLEGSDSTQVRLSLHGE